MALFFSLLILGPLVPLALFVALPVFAAWRWRRAATAFVAAVMVLLLTVSWFWLADVGGRLPIGWMFGPVTPLLVLADVALRNAAVGGLALATFAAAGAGAFLLVRAFRDHCFLSTGTRMGVFAAVLWLALVPPIAEAVAATVVHRAVERHEGARLLRRLSAFETFTRFPDEHGPAYAELRTSENCTALFSWRRLRFEVDLRDRWTPPRCLLYGLEPPPA